MRNASFLDYRMPTCLDLPMIETIIVEVPNPTHPFGVRGVGEMPDRPAAGRDRQRDPQGRRRADDRSCRCRRRRSGRRCRASRDKRKETVHARRLHPHAAA